MIAKAAAATGLSVPVLLAAGGKGWIEVGSEGAQQVRDFLQRRAQEAAIKAQQEENRKRLDDLRKILEKQIEALAPRRAEALAKRAKAREQARLAKPAADSAQELLDSLRDLKTELETVAGACQKAEPLRKQIEQLVEEARDKAKTVVEKIDAADAKAASCQTQEDVDQIAWFLEGARILAGEAIAASARAEGLNNRLNTILGPSILDRARHGPGAVQHAEVLAAQIAQEAATADAALEATRGAIMDAEQKSQELAEAKNTILARIAALRGAFPADLQGPFERLVVSATVAGSLPEEDLTGRHTLARQEAERAARYSTLAQDLLSTIRGLPLCDGLTPADDLIAAAQQARTDALVYAGSDILSKLQACQAKLKVIGLALTPVKPVIKHKGSVSFKATASFGDGSSRDVTAESTWRPTGTSTFVGNQVGEFSVSADYGGQSAPTTVRVEELRVTALAISPARKTIKQDGSVSFKAVATFEDGATQTVTNEAEWPSGSTFTGTTAGTFTVAVTYKGQQAVATVTVEGKKKRDEEPPPRPPPAGKPPSPPPGSAGGYDPTKDPGMGGKPPDTAGASQVGDQRAGGGRPPGDTADKPPQGLGGGAVTVIPPAAPPPDTLSGSREPQPAQGGGWWCYSAHTQEWYQVPVGPCPPPSWKPPRGPASEDPAVRVPHDMLQPGPGMGDKPAKPGKPMGPSPGMGDKPAGKPAKPMGPSPGPSDQAGGKPAKPSGPACGPATSCRCANGGMGHIPCDKSKGACHCGAG
jgi:hypothetical protein